MRTLEELNRARADGTLRLKLKEMVERAKRDTNVNRQLAFLSPHLTGEERAYCQNVDQQTEWM